MLDIANAGRTELDDRVVHLDDEVDVGDMDEALPMRSRHPGVQLRDDRPGVLIEIAPGIDLQDDVLAQMDFKPIINGPLRRMDPKIFRERPMYLD